MSKVVISEIEFIAGSTILYLPLVPVQNGNVLLSATRKMGVGYFVPDFYQSTPIRNKSSRTGTVENGLDHGN